MADELLDSILENAAGPLEARNATESIKQHSIKDQIELHKYRANQNIGASPFGAMRHIKLRPPSAADTDGGGFGTVDA